MLKRFLASLAALLLLPTVALAAYQPGAVVQLPNAAQLATGNYVNTPQVQLSGYNSAGDGGGGNLVSIPKPSSVTATGTTANNSQMISNLSLNPISAGWVVGMPISDASNKIPVHTFILAVTATNVTISNPATGNVTGDTLTISCQNGGTLFQDAGGNCFQRNNIPSTMDMRMWGITSGSTYDANANLTSMTDTAWIFQAATQIGAAQGTTSFTTAGVAVFWANNYVPPASTSLTCDAPSVTQISAGYYVGIPGTIYTAHGVSYSPVNNQDGIGLHWCNFVDEWYANPARISQFGGISFNSPPTTYDDGEAMRGNMALAADTALNLRSVKGAMIDHIGCFGYDVCYTFTSSDHMNLSYMWGDGNVCMYGENGGGQSDSDHVDCEPFITKQANSNGAKCIPTANSGDNSNGICNELFFNVLGVSAAGTNNSFGTPECSFTVGYATYHSTGHQTTGWPGSLIKTSQTFSNGDGLDYLAFMANFDPVVSAGNANALGCKRSGLPVVVTSAWNGTSVTFTEKGSAYSTGASKMSLVASWAAGSSLAGTTTTNCPSGCGVLRIVSGDALNIQPGMIVADNGSSGIPSGSTVVAVVRGCKGPDRYDGYIACVFISNPTTLASVDATITFDGGTFTSEGVCDGAGAPTCAFFNTGERPFTGDSYVGNIIKTLPLSFGHHRGLCYFANGVAGWRQYGPFCYGHSYRWVFANANNWLTTDAHDDDNGELDWLDVVDNYTFGSTVYGSVKGNGYGKASDTVVNDMFNLTQNKSQTSTTTGSVAVSVGSTITTSSSIAGFPNDGTIPTGKLTVAICQNPGSGTCSGQSDNQYITAEATSTTTLKVLACGQFFTTCQGYTSGASIFSTAVGSTNGSVSFATLVADTTDVNQNVLVLLHGSIALTDFEDKGNSRLFYVSSNITPTAWNGVDAPESDVLYDGAGAAAGLSGCGNFFAGYSTSPISGSQASSGLWQCSNNGVIAGSFTPAGATTSTTLQNFGDRALSILDFNTSGHPATPDCSTSATSALAAAETAALAQGVHIIRMDGTTVGSCYSIGNHTVPAGIEILCPGPPSTEPANNDYRGFPNTLSLTSAQGITLSANTKISGCGIVTAAITSSAPPTTYQTNQARTAAFSGTAIQFAGPGSTVEQSMIVGFSTCFKLKSRSANTLWIHDVQTDCNTGYSFVGAAGGGNIVVNNFVSAPFATRAGTGGPPNETYLPLSTITDNGSGLLRVHLSSPCTTTNCPIGGDEIWFANPTPYQSAQGGWMPTIIDSSTIDLIGSDSSFLTGHTESNVVLTNGSNRITGISLTSINEIQPTQAVTGACIPANTQVLNIERNLGILWLGDANRNPVAATCAATENITITDQATGITAISSIATVSGGTGYAVGDTLQPAGGTTYNGNDAILTVTAVDAVTGAITATPSITMPGLYSVCPPNGSGVTDTNGSGTGATFNFTCSGSVVLYANNRTGADFLIQAVNDVRVTNGNDLGHAICVDWEKNTNGAKFDQVSCHDENQLQDQTHYGLVLNDTIANNGAVNQNSFCNGGIYYFGVAVLDASQSGTNLSSNVVCNNLLGGSKGGSGLQNTALDVVSPGGAKDDSLTFIGNYANIPGFLFIPNTIRSAQFAANDFPFSYLWGQDDTTYALVTGAGNNFASGSLSVSPKGSAINTVTANPGGGQANATLIIADYARVNAVATAGDSVQLRPAVAGSVGQTLYNSSTRTMQVFGNVGTADTINGIASNVGVPQAPGSVVRYTSTAAGALAATVVAASGEGALCPVSQPCVYSSMQTVNLNTVTAPAPTTPSAIETVGSDAGTGQNIEGNAQAGTMAYQGIRRDGTLASPTAVAVNEKDVSLSARAYDGATVPATSEAGYQCVTGENQTSSAHGHFCIALCTPNGSTVTQECWREDAVNTTQESLKFYGSAPAVSGTGTPVITAGSTDNAGSITGGTLATSIVLTFVTAKPTAPFCAIGFSNPSVVTASGPATTTGFSITQAATTGQVVSYVCAQH